MSEPGNGDHRDAGAVGPFALPGVRPSPNIQTDPDLYEIENRAVDPERKIEAAMAAVAP